MIDIFYFFGIIFLVWLHTGIYNPGGYLNDFRETDKQYRCMKDKVIVKAFSGNIQLSCNEYNMNEYYDTYLPEIDDSDYILEHRIDRVEQHFYSNAEYLLRINYYNAQGFPYKFDEIKNGVCTTEKL